MNLSETQLVWVVWANTDLTEGRGTQIPIAVCASRSTATRLGKGKDVQGSNCDITVERALKVDDMWYVPGHIIPPSNTDIILDDYIKNRKAVEEKARSLGLSQQDIDLLRSGK